MVKKKTKWYLYEQYEGRDGNIKERLVSQSRVQGQDYALDEVSWSRDKPKIRKQKRELYEAGLIGAENIRETALDYINTVEWGKDGGRPRKWDNEAQRKRVKRAEIKSLKETLKVKETPPSSSYISLTNYSHSNPRPGSYTYHSNRPALVKERVNRYRMKN